MAYSGAMDEAPVIGTIEHRPPLGPDSLPPRRPAARESSLGAELVSARKLANNTDTRRAVAWRRIAFANLALMLAALVEQCVACSPGLTPRTFAARLALASRARML